MELSLFAIDEERVNNGTWHSIGQNKGKIKVARANNKNYAESLQRKLSAHPELDLRTEEGKELHEKLVTEAMADAILVDWEGLKDHGTEIPYTVTAAFELLMKYPDFRDYVSGVAADNQHYRIARIKAVEGKSSPPSGGGIKTVKSTNS